MPLNIRKNASLAGVAKATIAESDRLHYLYSKAMREEREARDSSDLDIRREAHRYGNNFNASTVAAGKAWSPIHEIALHLARLAGVTPPLPEGNPAND